VRPMKPCCSIFQVSSSGADVMVYFDPFYKGTIEANLDNVFEWPCALPECIQTNEVISEKLIKMLFSLM